MLFTKIFLLVLLGATLVLASPVPEPDKNELSVSGGDNQIENVVNKDEDEIKIDASVDEVTLAEGKPQKKSWWERKIDTLKHIKKISKKVYKNLKTKWDTVKEQGAKLADEIKAMFKEIKTAGKEAVGDGKDA